jgi:endo-1,4-beta-xylanase
MRAFPSMLVSLLVAVVSLSCTADPTTDVTIPAPVASLSVQPTDAIIQVGTSTQLSAVALDSSGQPLAGRAMAWTSSDESVARVVREVGVVIAVAPGSADVIATAEGKSAMAKIKVITDPPSPPTLTRLVLTPASVTLARGATSQFAVSGKWSDSSTTVPAVTYSATGGTITAGGLYTAGTTAGAFRVIAAHQGGTLADTSTVTVTPPTLVRLVLTPASITLAPTGTTQFVVSGKWSDSSTTVPAVTYSATGGTISVGGLYVAGTTGGNFRVIATHQGGTLADTSTVTISVPGATTLRQLATARGFEIGVAVRDTPFVRDPLYLQTLTAQYNSIGTEDATDFWPIHPAPTTYAFANADALVAFAQANNMKFHGHTLIWGSWIPTWVTSGNYTRDQLYALMKDHITTVVTRYRGKALSWDVLNEMLDNWPGTTVKPSFWLDHMGPEYMDSALVWARRADPGAKLYIDDYFTEFPGQKSDFFFNFVQGFRARGVPLDGVGFQMHISAGHPTWPGYSTYNQNPIGAEFQATLQRFANAGYDIRITELDVEVPDTAGTAFLQKQGQIYRDVLDGCLKVSRCKEMTTWGFTDKYSWIPSVRPGLGRGLPFDANYGKKPAFDSLMARLSRP